MRLATLGPGDFDPPEYPGSLDDPKPPVLTCGWCGAEFEGDATTPCPECGEPGGREARHSRRDEQE